jgi:ABC-2 type transport system permease protein
VQLLINGDNANTAATVMAYATETVRGVSARLRADRLGRLQALPLAVEPRVWFNPELSSTLFLVPGLIAFIAMITAVALTALSIVREKERGTMEQVRMAPVSTLSYVIGKTVPYFVLAFTSAMVILLAGMAVFDVPMRGSWLLLIAVTAVFLLGALGQGLLISTLSESQQIAFQVALLSSFLPTLLLSGFIFPIASMPAPVRLVTYIVPARYYLTALRGVVLKGVTIDIVVPQLAALAIFAAVVTALAAARLARQRG